MVLNRLYEPKTTQTYAVDLFISISLANLDIFVVFVVAIFASVSTVHFDYKNMRKINS